MLDRPSERMIPAIERSLADRAQGEDISWDMNFGTQSFGDHMEVVAYVYVWMNNPILGYPPICFVTIIQNPIQTPEEHYDLLAKQAMEFLCNKRTELLATSNGDGHPPT